MYAFALSLILILSTCPADRGNVKIPIWSSSVSLDDPKPAIRLFITPDLHDLVFLTKRNEKLDRRWTPKKVSLNNSIRPTVRVAVTLEKGTYHYLYTVGNAADARDFMIAFSVVVPKLLLGTSAHFDTVGTKNPHWAGYVGFATNAKQRELDEKALGRSILWVTDWDQEHANSEQYTISPGKQMTGFKIETPLRPGFATAANIGMHYTPTEAGVDIDDPVFAGPLHELNVQDYFDVTVLTFGPMFLPGDPASEVLQNYRLGMARLAHCSDKGQVSPFVTEISAMLSEPGVENTLANRLKQMSAKPTSPFESELMSCLQMVAASFPAAQPPRGGKR